MSILSIKKINELQHNYNISLEKIKKLMVKHKDNILLWETLNLQKNNYEKEICRLDLEKTVSKLLN